MLMDFQMEGGQAITAEITAAVLNNVSAAERKSLPPAHATGGIETQTGWMDYTAAYAQILTVPILLAVFACAFAVIRTLV